MLKNLIKARILALFDSLGQIANGKRKKKSSLATVALVVAILALLVVGSVGFMFYAYCELFVAVGAPWAFWVIAMIYASLLCIIGSIFTVKTQVFESKDNELLLSMPIPVKYIFLSRMAILLIVNCALELVVLLPCLVIYAILVGFTFGGVMCFLGVLVLLPFLVLALSTVVAWVISEISSRVRHKTAVTVALFLLIFGAYMYLSFSIGNLFGSDGALFDPSGLQNTLVFWWGADAISNGSGLSFLWLALVSVVSAAIVFVVLNKSFIRIITTKKSANKIEYKGNKTRSGKTSIALLKKELLRVFSSANYVLNTIVGYIMTIVISIALAVSSSDLLLVTGFEGYQWLRDIVPVAIVVICAITSAMSSGSAPSISLEDRQMWILKSCPVDPRTVLMAKLNAHVILCVPFVVIGATILCVAYNVGFAMGIFVVLTGMACAILGVYVGLFFGIKFPKFGWQNENAVIKQSAAVMLSMLSMMALNIGFGVLGYFTAKVDPWLAVFVIFATSVILSMIVHIYLMGYGAKEYENLKK